MYTGHVWMWELDCEESWAPKDWCFWTVVLEKTLESPVDYKEIQPVHPKGDQSWVFFGRTDAEAETPILCLPDGKRWVIGKDLDAGRDWGQEEKGTTEDEMAGQHHLLDGHEFEWTPGVGDGQGGLACCSSWGRKESDTTEWLNWSELNVYRMEKQITFLTPFLPPYFLYNLPSFFTSYFLSSKHVFSLPPLTVFFPSFCIHFFPSVTGLFSSFSSFPLVVVVQSFSDVWLFATPWTAASLSSLSFTICQSFLKLLSIELMMQ